MSEEQNWTAYRDEIKQKLDTNSPCIPFLGVFLTTVALSQEANTLIEDKGLERRRTSSFYEAYHILEAITVRNKLNRLRSQASRQLEEEEGKVAKRQLYIKWFVSIVTWFVILVR